MKRDMDLIREILLQIEKTPREKLDHLSAPEGYDYDTMTEHLVLLEDAGFVEGELIGTFRSRRYIVHKMTWDGHDFLDAVRTPMVWNEVKNRLLAFGGNSALEIVKDLAIQVTRDMLAS